MVKCSRGVSKRLSLWGQRRRPPPVAETGSRCWGRGQQDASDSAADAGSRNPGSGIAQAMTERLYEGRGFGRPEGAKDPLSEIAAPRRAGYLIKFQNSSDTPFKNKPYQGDELRVS